MHTNWLSSAQRCHWRVMTTAAGPQSIWWSSRWFSGLWLRMEPAATHRVLPQSRRSRGRLRTRRCHRRWQAARPRRRRSHWTSSRRPPPPQLRSRSVCRRAHSRRSRRRWRSSSRFRTCSFAGSASFLTLHSRRAATPTATLLCMFLTSDSIHSIFYYTMYYFCKLLLLQTKTL